MLTSIALVIVTLVLAIIAITGYDKYISLKIRAKLLSKSLEKGNENTMGSLDPYTKSIVKKVKVMRVGSYLVITMVLREDMSRSDEVEVEDPTPLIPLIMESNEGSTEVNA